MGNYPFAIPDGGYAPNAHLIYVDQYGADPTGVADSTAAFLAAQAAGGSGSYLLVMSAGTYLLGTSQDIGIFGRKQGIIGQGSAVTQINYVGSGTAIAAYDSSFSATASFGGRFGGYSINGTNASAGAIGMSWGNLGIGRCSDIRISNFNGTGSIGLYFKNGAAAWSEESEWTGINLNNNTSNVVYDTGSFDYSLYQFVIEAQPNQNGLTMQNAATLEGVRLEMRGNFTAAMVNTGSVFTLDPGNSSGTSRLDGAQLYISVECDGSNTGHVSIAVAGGASSQFNGTGVIQFRTGTASFSPPSINNTANVWLSGIVAMSGINYRELPDWQANDYGYQAMTLDPSAASGSQQLVSGTIYIWGVLIRYPTKVSTISLYVVGTAASGVSAGENFVGLYNSSGTLLASTAVDAAFGSTFSRVDIAITAQQLAPGMYWVAFLMNASGMPALARGSGVGATLLNANLSSSAQRAARVAATQTALPSSFTPSSVSGDANAIWAAVK